MKQPSMRSYPAEQRVSGVLGGQEDKWSIGVQAWPSLENDG